MPELKWSFEYCGGSIQIDARIEENHTSRLDVPRPLPNMPPSITWSRTKYVGQPNIIERLLGVSWHGKVIRATMDLSDKAKAEIDRMKRASEAITILRKE